MSVTVVGRHDDPMREHGEHRVERVEVSAMQWHGFAVRHAARDEQFFVYLFSGEPVPVYEQIVET